MLKKTELSHQPAIDVSKIKLVVFDLGGVLFQFQGGLEKLAQNFNLSLDQVTAIWKNLDDDVCRGRQKPETIWNTIAEASSCQQTQTDFISFWVNQFKINPDTHQLIRELSKKFAIGLLTNIYPGVFQEAIRRKKIPSLDYELVIQSCEIGFVKPEIQIYQQLLSLCDCSDEEILFIDDKREFLAPAQFLNWQTFLFNPKDEKSSVKLLRRNLGLGF